MNALVASVPTPNAVGPLLRTLVLCDLVNSTALVERLGDQRAAAVLRRHDRLARDLVLRHGGQEIDKTDGFLVMFERPIQGVSFALDYQRQLRELGQEEKLDLRARVGLHVGDVMVWENNSDDVAHGAKRVEVEGLVKPVAARLAGLALPGQTLASGVVASLAQRAHEELGKHAATARWLNHGRYRFKGVPEPLAVYEIGEPDIAPMSAPPWSSKAHREVPWWRRPATVAAEALFLLAGLSASVWWVLRPPQAIAFAERDWVVVGSLHNLTQETRFDDSLQAAFRISLEQSRYVNVLSELQVRDTLKRMERDAATPIDRAIGAEIAQREGARALIIPSVAEIGGKVRVTAEVIDPISQSTVYSDSADGEGSESAIESLDTVSQRVRAKLGESLAVINSGGESLPKVTSANLDALRAYALGTKTLLTSRYSEANMLFDQALTLDPSFAMARIGKARVYINSGDQNKALKELQAAMPLRDRMPPREALYFDALLATFRTPADMLEKWKLLGSMYPDLHYAQTNYGLFSWLYANKFEDAIAATRRSLDPKNSSIGASHYQLALLDVGVERFDEARQELDAAYKSGAARGDVEAIILAARGSPSEALKVMAQVEKSGIASDELKREVLRAALHVDAGHPSEAHAAIDAAIRAANADDDLGLYRRLFAGILLSQRSLQDSDKDTMAALRTYATGELGLARRAGDPDLNFTAYSVLFSAYLLAHGGDATTAQGLLDRTVDLTRQLRFPIVDKMRLIAEAEVLRVSGHAQAAVEILRKEINGDELYLTHRVLEECLASLQEWDEAVAEAKWLAQHRGRAYAEYGSYYLQRPYDVALAKIALSDIMEYSQRGPSKAQVAR